MRNILKGLLDAQAYRFPDAEELEVETELPEDVPEEPPLEEAAPLPEPEEPLLEEEPLPPPRGMDAAPPPESKGPVQYAQLQAELILKQAREEAEELLAGARAAAKAEQEEIRMGGRDEG